MPIISPRIMVRDPIQNALSSRPALLPRRQQKSPNSVNIKSSNAPGVTPIRYSISVQKQCEGIIEGTSKPSLESRAKGVACYGFCRIDLHCFELFCIALLRNALHCLAWHCFALLCLALVCIALHCFAILVTALPCIALLCIAMFCIALHCFALHCFA